MKMGSPNYLQSGTCVTLNTESLLIPKRYATFVTVLSGDPNEDSPAPALLFHEHHMPFCELITTLQSIKAAGALTELLNTDNKLH